MNTPPHPNWSEFRMASRPHPPELDTDAIMERIRQEAAVRPLRAASRDPIAAIPGWVCAVAASLAFLLTAGMMAQSIASADQTIREAQQQHIPVARLTSVLSPSTL